jgi:hypothetical protein
MERRQPRGGIQHGVAHGGVVPVHEHGSAATQTHVVAPHIEMEQRVAGDLGRRRRFRERRQVLLEPRRRADPEREERLRVRDNVRPSVQPELPLDRGRHAGRGRGRVHVVEGREYGIDTSGVPRRRPGLAGQVLDDERGCEAVVVPSERTREERVSVQRLVHAALVAEPIRRVVQGRDLHERRAPILQLDDEPSVRRSAVAGRVPPGDRRRTEGPANSLDVDRVRLHASEATEVRRRAVGTIADMAVLA